MNEKAKKHFYAWLAGRINETVPVGGIKELPERDYWTHQTIKEAFKEGRRYERENPKCKCKEARA